MPKALTLAETDRAGVTLRPDYDSLTLRMVTRPSDETTDRVRGYLGRADVRYYLSAGSGDFQRPLWTFGGQRRLAPPSRWGSSPVAAVLSGAARRQAAIEDELELIDRWTGAGDRAPRLLVTEVIGPPSGQDVLFWQACLRRLARRRVCRTRLLVLRHDDVSVPDGRHTRGDRRTDQILLALLLAGGYAGLEEFQRWSAALCWDRDRIDALTSTRDCASGTVYTYRDAYRAAQARAVYAAGDRRMIAEVAALVIATAANPLIATAALVDDPSAALAAGTAAGFADVARGRDTITRYGRALFRGGRADGWARIGRTDAGAVYLAALVAGRRSVSPEAAGRLLDLAERLGLAADAHATLAFHLGQVLAKGNGAEALAASIRCFDQVRTRIAATPRPGPEFDGSRIAAAYNGTALAAYRAGDRVEAMRAELAALDALGAWPHLAEQRVIALTNLAAVYGPGPRSRRRALSAYRQAWRLATATESLTGMAYVAAGMIPKLVDAGGFTEAENCGLDLLRHYDAAPTQPCSVERVVVASCWRLADVRLAGGAVGVAAAWYVRAVRRMRRPAPEVIGGVIRNLTAQPDDCPEFARTVLNEELAVHLAMATDAEALSSFAEGREHVV